MYIGIIILAICLPLSSWLFYEFGKYSARLKSVEGLDFRQRMELVRVGIGTTLTIHIDFKNTDPDIDMSIIGATGIVITNTDINFDEGKYESVSADIQKSKE